MTEESSKEGTSWPMPKFLFEIDLGTKQKGIPFQEVTGLDLYPKRNDLSRFHLSLRLSILLQSLADAKASPTPACFRLALARQAGFAPH